MKREMGPLRILYKIIPLGLAVLFMLSLPSCMFLPEEEEIIELPKAKPPEVSYFTHTVSRKDLIDSVHGYAKVATASEVHILSGQTLGKLKGIYVKTGDFVKKGDLLAELYAEELEYSVIKQKQSVSKAEINHELMRMDYEAMLDQEKTLKERVPLTVDPVQKQSLEDQLVRIENQRKIKEIDLENHRNDIKDMKERLAELQEELGKTRVYSPMDGQISFATTKKPKDAIPPEHLMFSIQDPEALIIIYTPAIRTELTRYELGMKIPLVAQGQEIEGEITLIDNQIMPPEDDRFYGSLVVTADNLPEGMKAGDLVEFNYVFETRKNVLSVPKSAIRKYLDSTTVQMMVDGRKVQRDVQIGLETNLDVEIVSGLAEGDEIIIE